jgi:hypothetical protein
MFRKANTKLHGTEKTASLLLHAANMWPNAPVTASSWVKWSIDGLLLCFWMVNKVHSWEPLSWLTGYKPIKNLLLQTDTCEPIAIRLRASIFMFAFNAKIVSKSLANGLLKLFLFAYRIPPRSRSDLEVISNGAVRNRLNHVTGRRNATDKVSKTVKKSASATADCGSPSTSGYRGRYRFEGRELWAS